nr:MAG TPA: hypothetical protein [Caudoviricetes sp.]
MQGAGGIGKHDARGNRRVRDGRRDLGVNHHLIHAALTLAGQFEGQGAVVAGFQDGGHKSLHLVVQGSKKRPFVDFGESVKKDFSGHLPCSFFTHNVDYLMVSDENESVLAFLALATLKSKHGCNGVHPPFHFLFLLLFKEQTNTISHSFCMAIKAFACFEQIAAGSSPSVNFGVHSLGLKNGIGGFE